MIPNRNNFCGGNYNDWLEVMLTDKCNGGCNWCIEKNGYHPEEYTDFQTMANAINKYSLYINETFNKNLNVILLGGEPCLYKDMKELIESIDDNVDIYITTNGSLMNIGYIKKNLSGIKGINLSIHHYDLDKNKEITGIFLNQEILKTAIDYCRQNNITIRFNCNTIKNYIDSKEEIYKYIQWAKEMGTNKIRFAELKNSKDEFINLGKIMDYQYGLNESPYVEGCNKDCIINDMPVNFRQMCGLQTSLRPKPVNPKVIYAKVVLYYDGKFYDGWQTKREEIDDMVNKEIKDLIAEEVKKGIKEAIEELTKEIKDLNINTKIAIEKSERSSSHSSSGGGCQY